MNTKQIAIGVVAGVAILAAVGVLIAKRNKSSKKHISDTKNIADTYTHKLNNLERRAKKEFKNVVENGEEVAEKINGMLKKAQTSFQ